MEMCRERGLEVEIVGEKRDNYTIPENKAARQAADELTAEREILSAKRKRLRVSLLMRMNSSLNLQSL